MLLTTLICKEKILMPKYHEPCQEIDSADEESETGIVFKHEKEGLSIYITIYNTNNNANEGGEAGLKQKTESGGQISGPKGKNANQGGQIAGRCGQNANQDGEVASTNCGSKAELDTEIDVETPDEEI
jgi:hypothetical protein